MYIMDRYFGLSGGGGDRALRIEECYKDMGGNFEEVLGRLISPALVEKFIVKFLDDGSYAELRNQMDSGTREDAFKAAHTLKGVCANLSITKLCVSASELTEELRSGDAKVSERAKELFEPVKDDYEMTVSTIRRYASE